MKKSFGTAISHLALVKYAPTPVHLFSDQTFHSNRHMDKTKPDQPPTHPLKRRKKKQTLWHPHSPTPFPRISSGHLLDTKIVNLALNTDHYRNSLILSAIACHVEIVPALALCILATDNSVNVVNILYVLIQ